MIHNSTLWIAAVYCMISSAGLLWIDDSNSRGRRLKLPLWLNFVLAGVTVILLSNGLSVIPGLIGVSHQEIYVALYLLCVFALCVELPGYLLNMAFDNRGVGTLEELQVRLIDVTIDPSTGIPNLRRWTNSKNSHLVDVGMVRTLTRSLEHMEAMNNVNLPLISIVLKQIESRRNSIQERSKHPFPLIVQVFSLSTLGFILGEILAQLRPE